MKNDPAAAGGNTELLELTRQFGGFLLWLLSWLPLSAIGIIVSGKFLAQRIPLGLGEKDVFDFNLVVFRIRATGDAVSLGFVVFILMIGIVSFVFGKGTELYLSEKAGLDIGLWNSNCAAAAFFSIIVSILFYIFAPFILPKPIIDKQDRDEQIRRLSGNDQ